MGWLVLALPAGVVLQAQTPQHDESRPMEQTAVVNPGLEKANELIGAKVVNDKQERLGTVEDIVLTPDRTAVSYVALSHGGVWGMGGKLFAVPWSQFEVGARDKVMVLSHVSPADLENAPGFDKSNWPAMASENWLGRAAAGSVPGSVEPMAAKTDMKHRRLSELVGLTVKNDQGEELGELENIVIDPAKGRVAYAILSMRTGFLGINKELAAVPWSSLDIIPRLGTARLSADKETLRSLAFNANEFPNLADREYSRKIHEKFEAKPYSETLGFVGDERPGRPATSSPWTEGSEYESLYNPNAVRTIHGTIESIGTFRLEGTTVEGLRLRIKTDDGKTVTVHAGPRPYVDRQNIDLHYGDEVTVMGSPAKMGWRDFIVASQIKKGNDTLDLRTKEGKPRWNADEFKDSR
ncbi:MAG: PRC-barrel domain-containing protein [Phycisphaerales bacterium]